MSRRRTIAKYGTNEEVFNGEALMTKNYLTAGELLLDTSNNRVVSAASKRLPKQAKAATKYPVSVSGPGVVLGADIVRERKEKLAAEKEAMKEAGVKPKTPKASKGDAETTKQKKSRKEDDRAFSPNSVPRVSSDKLLAARRPYKEEREREKKTEGRKKTEGKKTEREQTAMDTNYEIREEVLFDYDQKTGKYRVPEIGGSTNLTLDECKNLYMRHHYRVQITDERGVSELFKPTSVNAAVIDLTMSKDFKHYLYAGKQKLSINRNKMLVELFDLLHWVGFNPAITPVNRNAAEADQDVASQRMSGTRGGRVIKLEEDDDV